MTLTSGQVNKFEGIVTTHIETTSNVTFDQKIYLQITAISDYIINPIIFTTEASQETDQIHIWMCKYTNNDSGDIILGIYADSTDSYTISAAQLTIETTTNSPPDNDVPTSGNFTLNTITDSSKYYSAINYYAKNDQILIYPKVGYATE